MQSGSEGIQDQTSARSMKVRYSWTLLFFVLVLTGGVYFVKEASGPDPGRAWQAYLTNYLFWSGISFSALVFVAVLNITNARWGRPLKRLAEAIGAFSLPSFLLFWGLYLGREAIFPWIKEPAPGKEQWLSIPFLFARDGISLFLLSALSLVLIYLSLRNERQRDAGLAGTGGGSSQERPGNAASEGLGALPWKGQAILSPIFVILYVFVLTLVAFDLVMSLDPHWYSTLLGGYFFIGSFYSGLAGLVLLSGLFQATFGRETDLAKILQPRHFHDLGKLLFGFCMMTGYLFYTQFLVIWYGNIPEETHYLIKRLCHMPWKALAWVILPAAFAIPFVVLLIRKIKMRSGVLIFLSIAILAGMWLERLLLVAPSIWKSQQIPLGLCEALVTGGFGGVMALTISIFLSRFPLLPFSDPLFQEEWQRIRKETTPLTAAVSFDAREEGPGGKIPG